MDAAPVPCGAVERRDAAAACDDRDAASFRDLARAAVRAAAAMPASGGVALLAAAGLSAWADGRHPVLAVAAALVAGIALGAAWRPGRAVRAALGCVAGVVALAIAPLAARAESPVQAVLAAVAVAACAGMARGATTSRADRDAVRVLLDTVVAAPYATTLTIGLAAGADVVLGSTGRDEVPALTAFPWAAVLLTWHLVGRRGPPIGRAAPWLVGVPLAALAVALHGAEHAELPAGRVLGGAVGTVTALLASWLLARAFARHPGRVRPEPVAWGLLVLAALPLTVSSTLGVEHSGFLLGMLTPAIVEAASRSARHAARLIGGFAIVLAAAPLVLRTALSWGRVRWPGFPAWEGSEAGFAAATLVRLGETGALVGALAATARAVRGTTGAAPAASAGGARSRMSRLAFVRAAWDVSGSLPWGLALGLVAGAVLADACVVPLPATLVLAVFAGGRSIGRGAATPVRLVVALGVLATAVRVAVGVREELGDTGKFVHVFLRSSGPEFPTTTWIAVALAAGLVAVGPSPPRLRSRAADLLDAAQRRPWIATVAILAVPAADAILSAQTSALWTWAPWSVAAAVALHLAGRAPDLVARWAPCVLVPPFAAAIWWAAAGRLQAAGPVSDGFAFAAAAGIWACVCGTVVARGLRGPAPWVAGVPLAVALATLPLDLAIAAALSGTTLLLLAVAPLAWSACGTPPVRPAARVAGLAAAGAVAGWALERTGCLRVEDVAGSGWVRGVVSSSFSQGWPGGGNSVPDASSPPTYDVLGAVVAVHWAVLGALAGLAGAVIHRARKVSSIPSDHPVFTEGPHVLESAATAASAPPRP